METRLEHKNEIRFRMPAPKGVISVWKHRGTKKELIAWSGEWLLAKKTRDAYVRAV